MIEISVIVPIYNLADCLQNCLDSLLHQDFQNTEYILVDDGSLDNSLDICNKYASIDKRFLVVHKKNGGLSSARNAGIEMSHGEWIVFVDGDDSLNERALSTIHSFIEKGDSDIYMYGHRRLRNNRSLYYKKCPPKKIFESPNEFIKSGTYQHPSWSYIYKRSIIVKNRILFTVGLKYCEDQDFLSRLFYHIQTIETIPICLYNYISREGSIVSGRISEKWVISYLVATNNIINYYKSSKSTNRELLYYEILELLKQFKSYVYKMDNKISKELQEEYSKTYDNVVNVLPEFKRLHPFIYLRFSIKTYCLIKKYSVGFKDCLKTLNQSDFESLLYVQSQKKNTRFSSENC